jgi:hypothetical protein
MKIIMTGRRAPNQTWQEMKHHMIEVHGPLVANEMGGLIARYVQNYVLDGRYGPEAPAGRDMVAEVSFDDDTPMPNKKQIILDDEPKFAHQSDLFPLLTSETIIKQPGPRQASQNLKVLCYLAPREGMTIEEFASTWNQLDQTVLAITGLSGYAKSTVLPQSPPLSPYKAVAGLWFQAESAEEGVASWCRLISDAELMNEDNYFCLYVEENRII